MIWVLAAVAIVLLAVIFFAYAYKLAVREGLDAQYKTFSKPRQRLVLVWRGVGLVTGKLLLGIGLGLFVVIGIPIIATFSRTEPWDPQWRFNLVTRLIVFPLIIIGAIFYFLNSRLNPVGSWVIWLFIFAFYGSAKIVVDVYVYMRHSDEIAKKKAPTKCSQSRPPRRAVTKMRHKPQAGRILGEPASSRRARISRSARL